MAKTKGILGCPSHKNFEIKHSLMRFPVIYQSRRVHKVRSAALELSLRNRSAEKGGGGWGQKSPLLDPLLGVVRLPIKTDFSLHQKPIRTTTIFENWKNRHKILSLRFNCAITGIGSNSRQKPLSKNSYPGAELLESKLVRRLLLKWRRRFSLQRRTTLDSAQKGQGLNGNQILLQICPLAATGLCQPRPFP